jgi:hypothetical protein
MLLNTLRKMYTFDQLLAHMSSVYGLPDKVLTPYTGYNPHPYPKCYMNKKGVYEVSLDRDWKFSSVFWYNDRMPDRNSSLLTWKTHCMRADAHIQVMESFSSEFGRASLLNEDYPLKDENFLRGQILEAYYALCREFNLAAVNLELAHDFGEHAPFYRLVNPQLIVAEILKILREQPYTLSSTPRPGYTLTFEDASLQLTLNALSSASRGYRIGVATVMTPDMRQMYAETQPTDIPGFT